MFEEQGKVVLMEHGWLVDTTGQRIIDPTIVLGLSCEQPLFYIPGVARSWQEAADLENEWFPHVRFSGYGEDGMGHPEYRAAYEAALHQARSLMSPTKEFLEVRATTHGTNQQLEEGMEASIIVCISVSPSDG